MSKSRGDPSHDKKPGGRVTFPDDTAAGLHSNILFAQRLILAVIRQIIVVSLLNMSAGVIVPVHQKLETVQLKILHKRIADTGEHNEFSGSPQR